MKSKIKVLKKEHYFYRSSKKYRPDIPNHIDKYQYFYSSIKGKISLIKLLNYFMDGKDLWEIYSIKGDLFEDVERFGTKKEAEKRIDKLLK